jgi:hypothetical protein
VPAACFDPVRFVGTIVEVETVFAVQTLVAGTMNQAGEAPASDAEHGRPARSPAAAKLGRLGLHVVEIHPGV